MLRAMKKRYRGYAQVCPLAKSAEILCERWTLLVVRELLFGSRRFAELRRGLPGISPTMLSQRLRELADAGVIARARAKEYELTPAGLSLGPVLLQLSNWGQQHAIGRLRREDMEPSALMWTAHRAVRLLPPARVVIGYELTDAPAGRQRWWIVVEPAGRELCFKHPGFAVDVTVRTKLEPMSLLLLGKLSPREAVRTGAVELDDRKSELARTFHVWYPRTCEYPGRA